MVSGQNNGQVNCINGESSLTPKEPHSKMTSVSINPLDSANSESSSNTANSSNASGSNDSNCYTTLNQNNNGASPATSQNFNKPNSNNDSQPKNRICRDFLRGQCRRLYCKYPHVQSPDLVVFCHDFQNSKCPRINCKFLHYSIDEEEHYRKYGEFPIEDNYNINNGMDFEYNKNFFGPSDMPPSGRDDSLFGHHCSRIDCKMMHCMDGMSRSIFSNQNGFRNDRGSLKRMSSDHFMNKFKRCREDDIMAVLRRFEEEHLMLRRRVEANELKIAELKATNEYLMTQNAQIRLSTVQTVQCSRVVNPVTVTNTVSNPQGQTQATQVINAVSMAPVQVATPIVSMATPQTQIITNSGTPLAIAANTSQGQQIAITPQNISTLSTSGQPTQILGTSQITLTPAALASSISAPSMGLAINTSQALAISNATQPIISYPIMTHSILPH